jgi:hypothetical protein
MISIKRLRSIRIIEEEEFIDTLKLYSMWIEEENKSSTYSQNITNKEYDKYISVYLTTHGRPWVETIYEIFMWKDHIFRGMNLIDNQEAYTNYLVYLSQSWSEPLKIKKIENGKEIGYQWIFNGYVYEVNEFYGDDEARLLILEDLDKERRYFEKLRSKFDDANIGESAFNRPRIPESVRIEVWRRDGGKCARCGSREKLEYDHIVPISKGGSNTARNIELLCEKHNRSKGSNIV